MTVYIISTGRRGKLGEVNCVAVDDTSAILLRDQLMNSGYYDGIGSPWIQSNPNEDAVIMTNDYWWIKKEHWLVLGGK